LREEQELLCFAAPPIINPGGLEAIGSWRVRAGWWGRPGCGGVLGIAWPTGRESVKVTRQGLG